MPCLAKLDLSRLGPHPSGSNCMAELLALQGLKQGLVELRLEAASLPVQEMGFRQGAMAKHAPTAFARVALPAELVELKALRALHLLCSTKNAPNNTDIVLSAGRCTAAAFSCVLWPMLACSLAECTYITYATPAAGRAAQSRLKLARTC